MQQLVGFKASGQARAEFELRRTPITQNPKTAGGSAKMRSILRRWWGF